jgi:hypothetical protein
MTGSITEAAIAIASEIFRGIKWPLRSWQLEAAIAEGVDLSALLIVEWTFNS